MENCTDSVDKSQKKAAFTHNLISTSYHEAGHTIYGLLHFMKIESVQIFKDECNQVNGYTHFDFFTAGEVVSQDILNFAVYADVCLRYAGLTAEKYHFKTISGSDKFPMFLKDGSSEDTMMAAKLIKQYNLAGPGKPRTKLKKKLIKSILQTLQCNWESVNLVAHGLFDRKRLYYSDLKSLLTKQGENKKFWRDQFKTIDYIYNNYGRLDEQDLRIILLQNGLL